MSVDKLMKTMKDRDDLTTKNKNQLMRSLEERDMKLLDALMDAIRDKGTQ